MCNLAKVANFFDFVLILGIGHRSPIANCSIVLGQRFDGYIRVHIRARDNCVALWNRQIVLKRSIAEHWNAANRGAWSHARAGFVVWWAFWNGLFVLKTQYLHLQTMQNFRFREEPISRIFLYLFLFPRNRVQLRSQLGKAQLPPMFAWDTLIVAMKTCQAETSPNYCQAYW